MAVLNTFPSSAARATVMRELCRFTKSGTFDPASYPTVDGLYDVYIVGGGGGGYGRRSNTGGYSYYSGGGGGYAKMLKRLAISGRVAVTIGGAGVNGGSIYGKNETSTAGGATSFGNFGTVNGGSPALYGSGGSGGCGGASGYGGSFGGVDGNNGTSGHVLVKLAGGGTDTTESGSSGTGGGNVDYDPTNPYDNRQYGIGGNATYGVHSEMNQEQSELGFPPLNNNPGRGGMSGSGTYAALPGVCIIYGIPLE